MGVSKGTPFAFTGKGFKVQEQSSFPVLPEMMMCTVLQESAKTGHFWSNMLIFWKKINVFQGVTQEKSFWILKPRKHGKPVNHTFLEGKWDAD